MNESRKRRSNRRRPHGEPHRQCRTVGIALVALLLVLLGESRLGGVSGLGCLLYSLLIDAE